MDSIEYEAISNYLDSKSYPLHSTKEQKRIIRKKAKRYELVAGKLFRSLEGCQLLVIRHNELEGILKEIYDNSGHQCARYTCNIAKGRYYWPSMYKDIENYVTTCVRCQKNQSSLNSPTTPLKPLPIITKVWYRVGMDLTGPLIESNGYKHILSMIDHFTRWIETRPLKSKEATETNELVESSHKAIKQALVKSLEEKNENWSLFLEEITFSINIRQRATTNFSAFELIHGSRKARLPTEAQNQDYQHPEDSILDQWGGEHQFEKLIDFMQEAHESNSQIAGEQLLHSQNLIKQQFDKKLNPVSSRKLEIGDNVLIENVYRSKKGGKLLDKWIGRYPVTKVNRSTVQILRNKATRCVKRSKVKLYKIPKKAIHALPNKGHLDSQSDENNIQHEISDEDLMIPSSPFTGAEESTFEANVIRKSREEVFEFLNSMKDRIIESIKTNSPLNDFHRELEKRQNFSFKNLLEWSQEHFPSTKIPETRLMTLDTSHEVTEILIQWYLESFETKIPILQYTKEDFELSTKGQQKSMDYITKVLYPVLSVMMINSPKSEKELSVPQLSLQAHFLSDQSLEDLCVTWGGYVHGIELVNTCPMDNFVTLLSLHRDALSTTFNLIQSSPNSNLE
ncbi:hypothetical protein LOD99_570 [Oopsacas minuta]|uniref:Integrase zinc-binding domain-containing protein n=1 Tax=Oopsacas minuta TaxID=111878 RepID=A0AAV7K9J8_9METZ|nr:hypothetical protein LOD99_570 [Oopsacas minuta]